MFIERLINQGNAPLLERMVSFTQAKHEVLARNIANVSVPGYQQRDMSLSDFQKRLRERVAQRSGASPGTVKFDDLQGEIDMPVRGVLFHDRNNRSMEQLMTDLSSNALRHNLFAELLRKQYGSIKSALKERVE